MDQDRVNRNVNELSKRLLEGCSILSDSCPETNVPLVLTLDKRIYSVGTDAYYERDGSGGLRRVRSTASAPGGGLAPAALLRSSGAGGADATLRSPNGGGAGESSLSALVAEKLLAGYTLLSESCAVTNVPLLEAPDGRVLSVGTGEWFERRGAGLVTTARSAGGGASPAHSLTASLQAGSPRGAAADTASPSSCAPASIGVATPAGTAASPGSAHAAPPTASSSATAAAASAAAAAAALHAAAPVSGALRDEVCPTRHERV